MLAPYFSFGQTSLRLVYHDLINKVIEKQCSLFEKQLNNFINQLIWWDFSYYLLYHYSFTIYKPLNKSFETLPWNNDEELVRVWKESDIGYPLIKP
ncbi:MULTISPECIES: FAD-binding domain-containing protein [Bacillus cereus group]|uniref:FAD-binding domain-containing protein n=1 Tax=Bacillus cereus group TaxID=86661 RepID=UPI003211E3FF